MIKQLLTLTLLLVGGLIYLRDSGIIGTYSAGISTEKSEGVFDPLERASGIVSNDFTPVRRETNHIPYITIQYCTS